MGGPMQQLAADNERRERERAKRPGIHREDPAARLANPNGTGNSDENQEVRRKVIITEADVEEERWRQKARDEELLETLHRLSEHSLTTTRRLDDTYYTILERVGRLRSTINSLQELSSRTKALGFDFESETKEISRDIRSQTGNFNNFDDQRRQIGELETRIKSGQERALQVGQKLDKCRDRLAWVEKRDAEEVKRNTRFYRGIWSTLGIVAGILLLLVVVHYLRTPHKHLRGGAGVVGKVEHALNSSAGQLPPQVEVMMEELRRDRESKSKKIGEALTGHKENEAAASRLRVFDEL